MSFTNASMDFSKELSLFGQNADEPLAQLNATRHPLKK